MPPRLSNFGPYLRYKRLETIPLGMGAFERTENDRPLVNFGEVRCRVEVGGELCGNVYQSRGALCTHMERVHGEHVADADNEGNPSHVYMEEIKQWYREIMQRHDRRVAGVASDDDDDDENENEGEEMDVEGEDENGGGDGEEQEEGGEEGGEEGWEEEWEGFED